MLDSGLVGTLLYNVEDVLEVFIMFISYDSSVLRCHVDDIIYKNILNKETIVSFNPF